MKTFCDGRAKSSEIFARTLEAYSADGKHMMSYPTLSTPHATTTSGVLSAIPLKELHIDDLMSKGGFKFLFLKCDAANTNKAAAKVLLSELKPVKELLVVMQICAVHVLNTATIWGLGMFPYGSLLRTAHVYESRHFKGLDDHIESMLCTAVKLKPDPIMDSENSEHLPCGVITDFCEWDATTPAIPHAQNYPETGVELKTDQSHMIRIWRKLLPLIMGQKGPFHKEGSRVKSIEASFLCNNLWPDGPPYMHQEWTCTPGYSSSDYKRALGLIFGKTMPLPVASRWYN